jgi:hypothetical protein
MRASFRRGRLKGGCFGKLGTELTQPSFTDRQTRENERMQKIKCEKKGQKQSD